MALVKHYQRLTAPPLKVWVATKQQGEVLCAHCICMVGRSLHITSMYLVVNIISISAICRNCTPDFATPAQKRKRLLEVTKVEPLLLVLIPPLLAPL